jgi:hypothetical protein
LFAGKELEEMLARMPKERPYAGDLFKFKDLRSKQR